MNDRQDQAHPLFSYRFKIISSWYKIIRIIAAGLAHTGAWFYLVWLSYLFYKKNLIQGSEFAIFTETEVS